MNDQLRAAAQAVLDRWDSPKWEWATQGPTADLMAELRAVLAQPRPARLTDSEVGEVWFAAKIPGLSETHARALIRAVERRLGCG